MSGYPKDYSVPSRNRQYSNQPGALATPNQVMATDFTPESPMATRQRATADAMRQPDELEPQMDYAESNQPGETI